MEYTSLSPDEIRIAVQKEAREQFLSYGIANTQMKKIAENVGISRSTLYRYYSEKGQLTFLVTWQIIDELISRAFDKVCADSVESGFDKLNLFFEAYIELLRSNVKILSYFAEFDRLFEDDYPEFSEAQDFVSAISRFSELVSQFIIQGIEDGSIITDEEPALLASVFINAVVGTVQRVLPRSKHYSKEHGIAGEAIVIKVLTALLGSIKA